MILGIVLPNYEYVVNNRVITRKVRLIAAIQNSTNSVDIYVIVWIRLNPTHVKQQYTRKKSERFS